MNTVLSWLTSPAFTAFGAPTSWAELLGFVTGAVCVRLVASQNVWSWPLGIANNLMWILLFATAGLYADSGLQVVYIGLALWGWRQWLHGGQDRTPLTVSRTTPVQWVWLTAAGIAATGGLTWLLATATNSTVPFFDALTTALSLMATWGQCRKKLESWWLWIGADLVYVPLYLHKDLVLTAVLYVVFLALCVQGLVRWRHSLYRQGAPAASEVDTRSTAVLTGGDPA